MRSYATYLHDRILKVGQWDEKYMDIMHMLQQSIGIVDQDADYHLRIDCWLILKDRIYVPNCSELKKLILREFNVKPYSSHPGYHKTLIEINDFYYWPNVNKEVVDFMAIGLDCQQVKVK